MVFVLMVSTHQILCLEVLPEYEGIWSFCWMFLSWNSWGFSMRMSSNFSFASLDHWNDNLVVFVELDTEDCCFWFSNSLTEGLILQGLFRWGGIFDNFLVVEFWDFFQNSGHWALANQNPEFGKNWKNFAKSSALIGPHAAKTEKTKIKIESP
jgi:hypothetical protein